jgi:septal ring factor EnvC (AmiA/AmiB activator)
MIRIGRAFLLPFRAALLAVALPGLVSAQTGSPIIPQDRTAKQIELEAIERDLRTGEEERARLRAEIESLRSDRARLGERLVEVTGRIQAAETRVSAVEGRLSTLTQTETAIRRSLEARRGLVAEVLGALQRMGRRPPPALLVRPEDMLDAVRSSILLGAVLPELKSETEALAGDLGELIRLRTLASGERETLAKDLAGLVKDRAELALLMDARRQELAKREAGFAEEQQRGAALAGRAQSLRDLLARLESDEQLRRRALAEEQAARNDPRMAQLKDRIAALAGKDPAKLAPRAAFGDLRGALPLPVAGSVLRGFNTPDGVGGTQKGVALGTRSGAVVSSPADGWVAFAGPFRTYGQLLIVNAGGGYYILLAGMERINVSVGQFVVAGEPVAQMGDGAKAAVSLAGADASQPVLYVEFRKDGTSIDPAPWWATSLNEKVRG